MWLGLTRGLVRNVRWAGLVGLAPAGPGVCGQPLSPEGFWQPNPVFSWAAWGGAPRKGMGWGGQAEHPAQRGLGEVAKEPRAQPCLGLLSRAGAGGGFVPGLRAGRGEEPSAQHWWLLAKGQRVCCTARGAKSCWLDFPSLVTRPQGCACVHARFCWLSQLGSGLWGFFLPSFVCFG